MSRTAAICRYVSRIDKQPNNCEASVKTLRDARILRAAVVGLVWSLSACIGSPSGPKSGATVSGTVSGSQGGTIGNVTITVTPAGASALAAVQTTASGTYTVDNVPAGDGSITVSNVPSSCQAPSVISYTGLKNGGKRVLNITAPCGTTLP